MAPRPVQRARSGGFTLVELLVAVGIGSVVMGAGLSFFFSELAALRTERARRSAQMTARTALHFLVRHLEHVGRDPNAALFSNAGNATLPPAIDAADSDFIQYRTNLSDVSTDNDTTDEWEDVTFENEGGVLWVTQGDEEPIALTDSSMTDSHVPAGGLVLRYFDGVGNEVEDLTTAAARASVRRIGVTLTVVGGPQGASGPQRRATLSQDVFLRNVS